MEVLSKKEMQGINAGATYSVTCPYCGDTFSTTYWPLLVSQATAKVICEGKLHNHIIEVHYDNL